MTWAFCTCGWVGICHEDSQEAHLCSRPHNIYARRLFNQPHMSSDGVERLLAEAKWAKA